MAIVLLRISHYLTFFELDTKKPARLVLQALQNIVLASYTVLKVSYLRMP